MNTFTRILVLSVLVMSVACSNDKNEKSDADDTGIFLSAVGDNVYTDGPITSSSSKGRLISISKGGVIKTQMTDLSSNCVYVISGKIESVTKYSDGTHWLLRYTDTDISMTSSVASPVCTDFVSQYKFTNIPKTNERILCGYNREIIDFSCDGNKDNSANWVSKK